MSKSSRPITSPKIVLLIAFTFTFTVILNYLYERSLFLLGIDIIKGMQKHGNKFYDIFFLIITMFIDPSIVILGVVLLLVLSKNKKHAYLMTIFILFNTYCAATLKAYHIDPRPIWTHNSVRNIGFYCPVQYGNPSGHSWFSAILGFGFVLQYFGTGKYGKNIILSIIFCIVVPMSRMYLGAHSLDQVLYGLAMGLQICILFQLQLKHSIEQFMFNFNKGISWKVLIIVCHIVAIVPFFWNYNNQIPQIWIDNIFLKCHTEMNQAKLNFLMLMVNSMLVNIAAGFASGYHKIADDKHGRYYLSGNWRINRQKYGRYLGYILYIVLEIALLFCGIAAGMIVVKMFSSWVIWYLALSTGAYFSGYVYSKKTIQILGKFQLIQQGRRNKSKSQ